MFNNYPSLTADMTKYCRYCSTPPTYLIMHTGKCPRIRSIEYYPDGSVKRVYFFGDADDPSSHTTEIKK